MISITGSTAPLHRRFNEKDSLRQIRNRYLGLYDEIFDQVLVLQQSETFLNRCQVFYGKGYKDWHILAAIYNWMMNLQLREAGNRLMTEEEIERSKPKFKQMQGVIYPVNDFLKPEFDIMFTQHALACLAPYGFQDRPINRAMEPMVKFLRERMKHFDLDIPHPPMFGRPPNDWPQV